MIHIMIVNDILITVTDRNKTIKHINNTYSDDKKSHYNKCIMMILINNIHTQNASI